MMKKMLSLLLAGLMIFALVGCGQGTEAPKTEGTTKGIPADKIKVGFTYVGPVGDEGYSYAHDQGRKALEAALKVQTVIMENVPEGADCEKAIRDLIDQGCNVIYATSFGHMDWIEKVSKDYPNIYFGHATGYKQGANLSNYMGRIEEPRYLSGIAAGLKTKSNKIGYVAAMPIPEVVRGINSFTLGVRSVNPKATVEVLWTNSWYDPSMEKSAAIELLNKGCDVMAQHCDSTAPQLAAQEKGAFAVGYNSATYEAVPKAYLTAPLFNWGAYYIDDVQKIIDGTWQSRSYWEGMKAGAVKLDELSPNCAEGTKEKVEAAKAKIMDGSLKVFQGPIKDNKAELKVAEGQAASDADLLSMLWFVEGVIGTVPSK